MQTIVRTYSLPSAAESRQASSSRRRVFYRLCSRTKLSPSDRVAVVANLGPVRQRLSGRWKIFQSLRPARSPADTAPLSRGLRTHKDGVQGSGGGCSTCAASTKNVVAAPALFRKGGGGGGLSLPATVSDGVSVGISVTLVYPSLRTEFSVGYYVVFYLRRSFRRWPVMFSVGSHSHRITCYVRTDA